MAVRIENSYLDAYCNFVNGKIFQNKCTLDKLADGHMMVEA